MMMTMIQIPKEFVVLGKKQELKRKCNFRYYLVKQTVINWFEVTSIKKIKSEVIRNTYIVRIDEVPDQWTCTCMWGTYCVSSGDFGKDCWHIRVVRETLMDDDIGVSDKHA